MKANCNILGIEIGYKRLALIFVIGVVTGLVNGLLGIGGGTILIPAMVFLLSETQHQAHGTSLAIILPTALVSSLVYQSHGNLDLLLAAKVATSGMVGGYLGAKLMNRIPPVALQKIFGIFMGLAGLRMMLP
ncbi:hypothetical protein GGQ84_000020 [Desulfitispora alkaliphila]